MCGVDVPERGLIGLEKWVWTEMRGLKMVGGTFHTRSFGWHGCSCCRRRSVLRRPGDHLFLLFPRYRDPSGSMLVRWLASQPRPRPPDSHAAAGWPGSRRCRRSLHRYAASVGDTANASMGIKRTGVSDGTALVSLGTDQHQATASSVDGLLFVLLVGHTSTLTRGCCVVVQLEIAISVRRVRLLESCQRLVAPALASGTSSAPTAAGMDKRSPTRQRPPLTKP